MDTAPVRPNREPWIFLAACLVLGLAFQGSRGLFETDEGRYAECARELLASGNWLLPTLQGRPHLTKPPGTYWLIAAGLEVLGRNAWGARIALGLAFAGSAWCVRVIGRVLLGRPAGSRAGWIYLTSLYPFAAGSILTTDTFLAASVLGSIACVAVSTTRARPWVWLAAGGAALGAAIFIKGHPALLPWAACVAGFAIRRERPAARWWAGLGCAAALAVVAGSLWFWWAGSNVPGASEHFGREVSSRLFDSGDHKPRAWWFYPMILIVGAAPWWVPVVRGMRRTGLSDAGRTLLVWAGVTFLVLQIVPAKLQLYVLPVAAPLALWGACGARDPGSPWPARPWVLCAWLAFLCGLRFAASVHEDPRDMRRLAAAVQRADPSGTVPVAVYCGRDVQGLDFYLDGRPQRVRSRELWTQRTRVNVRRAASGHARRGTTWLLVVEDEHEPDAQVAAIAGEAAQLAEETPGYRIYRIVPPRR